MSTTYPSLGKYQILEEIGRGGMGAVYKGFDPFLNRTVAIKLLAPHLVWEKAFVERFLREARAVAQLHHPNVIDIYDVGQDGNNYYFVMAFLPGMSLTRLISQKERLTPAEARTILRQLADALDYAHSKGLVHRDVKPANVMFDERGQVVLTDFGIVKAAEESRLTGTGATIGTPHYMAPEQVLGQQVDARTDQYALGVIAFEMLTGRVPFDAPTTTALLYKQVNEPPPSVTAFCPDLPPAVEPALNRALSKLPAERYASCGEFVAALEQALGPQAIATTQPVLPPVERTPPHGGRSAEPEREPQPALPSVAPQPTRGPTAPPASKRGIPGWAWIVGVVALLACMVGVGLLAVLGGKLLGTQLPATPTLAAASQRTLPPTATRVPAILPPASVTIPGQAPTRASATPAATSMPKPVSAISPANAEQVTQLALWDKSGAAVVAWSPDGKLLAIASTSIYLLDTQTLKQIRSIEARGVLNGIAFSPDGTMLASSSYEGVKLWQVDSGSELRTFPGITSVKGVAFSSDGTMLAVAAGKTIKLLDVASGSELNTLVGQTSEVTTLAFAPDGKTLASGSVAEVILWDATSGRPVRTLKHDNWLRSAAFSPDGRTLATGSIGGGLKLWDVASGRELRTLTGHTGHVNSVTFSPDGTLLASASDDVTIKLWEVSSGRDLRTLKGHSDRVQSVAFSPDGTLLTSGAADGTVRLWGVTTTPALPEPTRSPSISTSTPMPQSASAISPANAEQVTQLVLWDKSGAGVVAWSPDGKLLAIATTNIYLLDAQTLKQIRSMEARGVLNGIAFSPDGTMLASSSYEGVKLWQVASGSELRTFPGITSVKGVTFSSDGTTLAVAAGKAIKLLDGASGSELNTLVGQSSEVTTLAFAPDGKTLASGSMAEVIVWDAPSGRQVRTLKHDNWLRSVAFSPDGRTLASGSIGGGLKLWDVASGRELRSLTGHTNHVNSATFSPDGTLLASASDDVTIKLWEVTSGRELRTLKGHSDRVQSVAFSPDGALLASGAGDGTVRLWGVK